jgi:hypothetical protein
MQDAFSSVSHGVTVTGKTIGKGGRKVAGVVTEPMRKVVAGKEKRASAPADVDEEDTISDDEAVAAVPPDAKLTEMDIIFTKSLRGISIQDFYDIVWAEGKGNEHPPVYEPWLEASGKEDIKVQDWEIAEPGNEFVGDWCNEKYTHKRVSEYGRPSCFRGANYVLLLPFWNAKLSSSFVDRL